MMYRIPLILTITGALLIVVAVVIPFVFPSIFVSRLNEKLTIRPNSDILKSFETTPFPITLQMWFFNVTNSPDVYNGQKPILQQLGPYTYKQINTRVGVKFNHEEGTVAFRSKRFYYFDKKRSKGSEEDLVTTINPVYITLASKLAGDGVPSAALALANLYFLRFNEMPFMTKSVGDLLFHGYDEPLLGELYKLTGEEKYASAKFGFFYNRNGTEGVDMEIFTGELGMENYQHISKWNGTSELEHYPENRCNVFNGTDGSMFTRPVRKDQPIRMFVADLCRSIYGVFEKDVKIGPLTISRYVLPCELLSVEKEKCFCTSNFTCRNSMVDVSPCRKAPVVVSSPHFLYGDEEDINNVVGLHPTKEEHETFMDIEPNTGVPIRVAKRIQVNMPLKKYVKLPSFKNVPELIMPILWLNESVHTPIERVEKLYATLNTPFLVVNYGSWALLVIGLLLILTASLLLYKTYKKNAELSKRRQELSDKSIEERSKKLLEKTNYY